MAARLDEIAEGIASVLGASLTPEPLVVDMRNQSPVNIAFFVRALAAACERQAFPLAFVRVGTAMGQRLTQSVEREPLEGDVEVELLDELGTSIEIYRRKTTHPA